MEARGIVRLRRRRPLTSTGTNLLGLIKHLSIGEAWYFGAVFGRPFPEHLPWWDDGAEPGADMWVTEDEQGPASSGSPGANNGERGPRSPC